MKTATTSPRRVPRKRPEGRVASRTRAKSGLHGAGCVHAGVGLPGDHVGGAEEPVEELAAELCDCVGMFGARDQVVALGRHLAGLCDRDGLVFVLISNKPQVPELPGRYLMLDPETLRYENSSRRSRPAPGYKEPDLERLMPAFEVETSYLLRSGVQEYVLTPRSVA